MFEQTVKNALSRSRHRVAGVVDSVKDHLLAAAEVAVEEALVEALLERMIEQDPGDSRYPTALELLRQRG